MSTPPAEAQSTFKTFGRDVANGVGDIWFMWTSPFHADAADWSRALATIGGAAALSLADGDINQWMLDHPSSPIVRGTRPWRERDKSELRHMGTARRLAPLSGILYIAGMASGSRKLREAGMGCLTGHEGNSLLRGMLYEVVSRPRPSVPNADPFDFEVPGGPWEEHSFFGGHTANIWACTTFFNTRYHLGVAEPVLYLFATGLSVARMTDQRHWASDTMVGMAVGYAMGHTIAKRMARREARDREKKEPDKIRVDDDRLSWQIAPVVGGISLGAHMKF